MRLYAGSSEEFISDNVHNRIADKLRTAYFASYRREASRSEVELVAQLTGHGLHAVSACWLQAARSAA